MGIRSDGNCVFGALSKIIYGYQEAHVIVRQSLIKLTAKLPSIFNSMFIPVTLGRVRIATLEEYCKYMFEQSSPSDPYRWGGCMEIYAASMVYERPCLVHVMDIVEDKMVLNHYPEFGDNEPIRLSFEVGDHYNALITPGSKYLSLTPGEMEDKRICEVLIKTVDPNKCGQTVMSNGQLSELLRKKRLIV